MGSIRPYTLTCISASKKLNFWPAASCGHSTVGQNSMKVRFRLPHVITANDVQQTTIVKSLNHVVYRSIQIVDTVVWTNIFHHIGAANVDCNVCNVISV
jgi:hypothetical protein